MGPGILPETTVGKHNPPCHLQMPTKALSVQERKSYVNMVQKRVVSCGPRLHLKWTDSKWKSVLWSGESKFDILVGNHGRCVLRAKEEGDRPALLSAFSSKASISDGMGCISAYGMGSLHV